jgi:hypothetical protein
MWRASPVGVWEQLLCRRPARIASNSRMRCNKSQETSVFWASQNVGPLDRGSSPRTRRLPCRLLLDTAHPHSTPALPTTASWLPN